VQARAPLESGTNYRGTPTHTHGWGLGRGCIGRGTQRLWPSLLGKPPSLATRPPAQRLKLERDSHPRPGNSRIKHSSPQSAPPLTRPVALPLPPPRPRLLTLSGAGGRRGTTQVRGAQLSTHPNGTARRGGGGRRARQRAVSALPLLLALLLPAKGAPAHALPPLAGRRSLEQQRVVPVRPQPPPSLPSTAPLLPAPRGPFLACSSAPLYLPALSAGPTPQAVPPVGPRPRRCARRRCEASEGPLTWSPVCAGCCGGRRRWWGWWPSLSMSSV